MMWQCQTYRPAKDIQADEWSTEPNTGLYALPDKKNNYLTSPGQSTKL
jgi:hypothetical protein